MTIKQGYYASWRGVEYEASPDGSRVRLYTPAPAEGFAEAAPGRHVRVVTAEELDLLSYVTTVCTWQGEPFQILGEHETWLRVEYTGGQEPVALQLGLEVFDRGVFQAWAPRTDVQDLREDIL